MDIEEVFKKVRHVEIKTKRLSEHIFIGRYHSSFKGRGMTFNEVRPYQYGDDVRAIDWNKTAHFNEPYVKVFGEERELTLMLMVDVSASMLFGARFRTKKEIMIDLCATLAFSAIRNNDKVGALLFSDQVELFIPPKKGRMHVLRLIKELIDFRPLQKRTSLCQAIEYLMKLIKRKSIVFILSDFTVTDYEKSLRMAAKKHALTGIRIFDEKEKTLSDIGMLYVEDQESGELGLVDTSSKAVRRFYEAFYRNVQEYFFQQFRKSCAKALSVRTDENHVKKLLEHFKCSYV